MKANSANQKPKDPSDFQLNFEWEMYIPFQLVRTQLWMHRMLRPESSPSVREIAQISKTESRVMLVAAFDKGTTPSEISDKIGLDRATVTRTLGKLVSKSLVDLTVSQSDQRSKRVYLTEQGGRLCQELILRMKEFDTHLAGLLSEEEKVSLANILAKLLEGTRNFSPDDKDEDHAQVAP